MTTPRRPWMQAHDPAKDRAAENVQSLLFAVIFVVILFAVTLAPVQ